MTGQGSQLDVVVSQGELADRVIARGELDLQTVPDLADTLERYPQERDRVILDLSRVTFMDSSGLSLVLTTHLRAARGDWSFELAPMLEEPVRALLNITSVTPRMRWATA